MILHLYSAATVLWKGTQEHDSGEKVRSLYQAGKQGTKGQADAYS